MAAVTIRNLNDDAHRALKKQAAEHGRSTEAEMRWILEEAVGRREKIGLGSALAALADKYGGFDLEIVRDKSPVQPAEFE